MAAPAKRRKTGARARKAATAKRPAQARRRRSPVKTHGTEAGYQQGCRCEKCTAAASQARIARRDRKTREVTLDHLQRELKELQSSELVPGKRVSVPEELYRSYVEARAAADAAERDLLIAELELKRAIGDGETFTVRGRAVGTWARFSRTFFDTAAFRKAHPAMWEKFQTGGNGTRRFIVTMYAATPPQRRARAVARGQRR